MPTPWAKVVSIFMGGNMTIDIERILGSRKVPTLPAVAVKLLNLIGDPDVDRQEVAATVKIDPGIASRVLQACNTSYYGLKANVRSVDHAVLLLGPGTLSSLCLTFSLSSFSFAGGDIGRDFTSVWEQSILRSVAAETLAKHLGHREVSNFFSKAILCDIGRLAILAVEPEKYHEVFEAERDGVDDIVHCENEILGANHVDIGMSLAEKWKLPESYVRSIAHHHKNSDALLLLEADPDYQSYCILAIASLLSEFILFGQNKAQHDQMMQIASDRLGVSNEALTGVISEVRERADDLPQELNISAKSLPSADELRDCASDLLSAIAINTDANIEAVTTEHRMLEMKNTSLRKTCEDLEQQANVDFLTQLYNRNFFDLYLGEQLTNQARDKPPIGVIIGDIDKFKTINDRFGHQAGDAIIKEVAQRLATTVGEAGVAARYGGEEFVIATVGMSLVELGELAESIRTCVDSSPILAGGKVVSTSISLGYATTTSEGMATPVTIESLVGSADEALYSAKHQGRNRSVSWVAPPNCAAHSEAQLQS